jgi:translation initiation factor 3 subunit A
LVDVDDLDAMATPESLLLNCVSSDDTKDRTERQLLTPWVRFLWEAYRTVLDILRNNARLEVLYNAAAKRAFDFCIDYNRRLEFRRLCEVLRLHLQTLRRSPPSPHLVNLGNPESMHIMLVTRFEQLRAASRLELWQEGFKSIEDINVIMAVSKRPPKPPIMATYFEKIAEIFWKSKNLLFHAASLTRHFAVCRENNLFESREKMVDAANLTLLAVLAVPITRSRTKAEDIISLETSAIDRTHQLASILSLDTPPSRETLIADLVRPVCRAHVFCVFA